MFIDNTKYTFSKNLYLIYDWLIDKSTYLLIIKLNLSINS